MRKLQRLKHLLWHVCHFHSPTCTTVEPIRRAA